MRLSAVLVLLFSLPVALAATPQLSVSLSLNETTGYGSQDIGFLVLTHSGYLPTFFDVNAVAPFAAEQNDALRYVGADVLNVSLPDGTDVALAPQQVLPLMQEGLYVFATYGAPNTTAIATVAAAPVLTATISAAIDNPLSITVQNSTVIVPASSSITAPVHIVVPDAALADSYDIVFSVSSDAAGSPANATYALVLPVLFDWSINTSELPAEIMAMSDSFITAGKIRVQSSANADMQVSVNATGNASSMIVFLQETTLYARSFSFIPVHISVPARQEEGLYKADLLLSAGNRTETVSLKILVTDTIPPSVLRIAVSDEFVHHTTEITAEARDNTAVVRATIQIDADNEIEMTKDQQLFFASLNFSKLTSYTLTVCAIDRSGNRGCESITHEPRPLSIIQALPDLEFPSRKIGLFSSIELLRLSEIPPLPVSIRLLDFTSDSLIAKNITIWQGEQYRLSVKESDGASHELMPGGVVELTQAGVVLLEILAENVSTYYGKIALSVPDTYQKPVEQISFHGRAANYDVPPPITGMVWFTNPETQQQYILDCPVNDTGDQRTVTWGCSFVIPVSVDQQDFPVPTTLAMKTLIDQRISDLDGTIRHLQLRFVYLFSFLVVAGGVLLVWIVYRLHYKPILRLRLPALSSVPEKIDPSFFSTAKKEDNNG